ncbi:MAG: ABC transporter ATP-binding protein [Vicinamibacterales bacterium]
MNAVDPAVSFTHVTKRFGAQTVLSDVSFRIPAGRAFCLLGRSGTGKSVTLRHIVGLVTADEGDVRVAGFDIARLQPRELSRVRLGIGFLFQSAALFDSMTVGENVAFPLHRHTRLSHTAIRARVRERLADVGLQADIDKMPGELSGGMRKRAGLARAMALDPSLLLVDEPSAGLDPLTASEIDELLVARKRAGTTLVIVTHNIPSARVLADEIAVLDGGRIIARGSARDLDASADPLVQAFMRSASGG